MIQEIGMSSPIITGEEKFLIPQYAMIEQVRQLCTNDPRVVSALMFGSFAIGEGDQFSDIEEAGDRRR